MTMWNKDRAFKFLIDFMQCKYYKGVNILDYHNIHGHRIVNSKKKNIYFLFKHDMFHSFQNVFAHYKWEPNTIQGIGESINIEYLKRAMDHKCDIVFTYRRYPYKLYTPSRDKLIKIIKTIYPNSNLEESPTVALLKIFCEHYHLIRTQERENKYQANDYTNGTITVNETTYCFPFKLMERLL